jgi:transglutaminase superfamily protein
MNISSLDIARVIAKIVKIPDNVRRFEVPADHAVTQFRVSLELQDELLAAGMPSIRRGGVRYFDNTDLLNVSLHLDIRSRQRKLLGWWARELERPYGESATYRVDYLVGCPQWDHQGACTFNVLRPGSTELSRTEYTSDDRGSEARYSRIFTLRRNWPPLPPAVREIIDHGTRGISFMQVQHPIRWDISFIQREKVADCGGIAKILFAEATSRGIPARLAYGVALTPPIAVPHFWSEFLVDDIWVPVDPLFIEAIIEWGILNKDRWNRYESLGGILAGMAPWGDIPLVLHNSEAQWDVRFRVFTINELNSTTNGN